MTSTAVRQTLNHVMPLFTLLISLYQFPYLLSTTSNTTQIIITRRVSYISPIIAFIEALNIVLCIVHISHDIYNMAMFSY